MATRDLVPTEMDNDVDGFIDDAESTVVVPDGAMAGQFYKRIGFPSQMDNGWMFPTDGDDREEVSSFEGIIVAISYPRTFYPDPYDPDNPSGPLCASDDGRVGEVDQSRFAYAKEMGLNARNDCGRCQYAQWQANPKCDPAATVWVLLNGEAKPSAVRCPKGSLSSLRQYRESVGGHAGIWQFVTRFSIGKSDNKRYKVAKFDVADIAIDSDMMEAISNLREQLIGELSQHGVIPELQEEAGQAAAAASGGVKW